MFLILHALGIFVADMFKSRCRLQAENLFLRHQLKHLLVFDCAAVPAENVIRKSIWTMPGSNSLFLRSNSLFPRKNSLFR
jgi:hypothetical protein